MISPEKQRLEVERAIGEQHQRAWESTIEPFFIDKEKQIFDAFCNADSDRELIFNLKLQQSVLLWFTFLLK